MRFPLRRVRIGLSVLTATSALVLLAPSPASADTCYTVGVGPQSFTVCPHG